MSLFDFLQFMDLWTPSPAEDAMFLLLGILIYSLPVIIVVVIILVVRNNKRKNNKESSRKEDIDRE